VVVEIPAKPQLVPTSPNCIQFDADRISVSRSMKPKAPERFAVKAVAAAAAMILALTTPALPLKITEASLGSGPLT
jgi:hypothetical protein